MGQGEPNDVVGTTLDDADNAGRRGWAGEPTTGTTRVKLTRPRSTPSTNRRHNLSAIRICVSLPKGTTVELCAHIQTLGMTATVVADTTRSVDQSRNNFLTQKHSLMRPDNPQLMHKLLANIVWYGIVGFNVPLDTL